MTDINPRSVWDPRYGNGDISLTGLAEEVFVHHTVTTTLSPGASVGQEIAELHIIESIGHSRFATPEAPNFGIPYNVLIFPSGRAYEGVSFNRRGAHTDGRNSTTRSICFVGNYEEHEPTPAALDTARSIYHEGKGKWWVDDAPLYGHRDLKATACPGRNVYDQLDYLRTPPRKEGLFDMLSDDQQKELLVKVRELHTLLAGAQVDMPWDDPATGKAEKYTIRSALKWIASRVEWPR